MGLSSGCTSGSTNMIETIIKSAPKYQILLELDNRFRVWDVEDIDGLSSDRFQSLTQQLENLGALRKVKTESKIHDVDRTGRTDTTSKSYAKVYEWNPEARDKLETVVEQSDTLPCGHRGHIRTVDNTDGYICKYCRIHQPDDERLPYVESTYDRKTVKQSL